jgi:solute:Na+ symporter, SSS family
LPAVILGAYTRWFNDWALLVGWGLGIAVGTGMAAAVNLTPSFPLQIAGHTFPGYTALYTVILNIALSAVLTPVFNAITTRSTPFDETVASDYHA